MFKKILITFLILCALVFILRNKSREEITIRIIPKKIEEIYIPEEVVYTKKTNRLLEKFLLHVEEEKKRESHILNNPPQVINEEVMNILYHNAHNSHDSNLNFEMSNQYERMVKNLKINKNCPDLRQYLAVFDDRKINIFLNKVSNEPFRNMGSEWDIYYNIWFRIFMFNGLLRDSMIDSFLMAIQDCVQDDGYIHCSSGRVSRLFSSLAVLDPEFGVLKSEEILKKEIYDKCSHLIENFEGKEENLMNYLHTNIKKEYTGVVNKDSLDKILKSISEAYD